MAAEQSTSERLLRLADSAPGETITLGWLLDGLHERAFGVFLLILALPCCIPFLYGVPQVVAFPLLFVSAQLVAGRRAPWLPKKLRDRSIQSKSLADIAHRAGPYLRFFEKLSRPRLGFLTRRPIDRVVALLLVAFSLSIMVPLPGTNTVPGIAVAIISLGFLERDGILVGLGALLGTAWITFLLGAAAGLATLAIAS